MTALVRARAASGAVCVLLLFTLPRAASAEEGLFITRIGYGVSTVRPEMPDIGTVLNGSMDLTISERAGVIGSTHLVMHDEATTLGFGLGFKYLVIERFWKRLYIHVSPELLYIWPKQGKRRWDVALRGGLGYEQLFMWGFGFVIEVHGTAPAGRGPHEPLDAASAGATFGLFMEF